MHARPNRLRLSQVSRPSWRRSLLPSGAAVTEPGCSVTRLLCCAAHGFVVPPRSAGLLAASRTRGEELERPRRSAVAAWVEATVAGFVGLVRL